jgi:hypothetical protein
MSTATSTPKETPSAKAKNSKLLVLGGIVILVVVVIVVIVLLISKKKTSSGSGATYNLPISGNTYNMASENVAGSIGSWYAMGTTLIMNNAAWCDGANQNFNFEYVSAGATPDRAIYNIKVCVNGLYLQASDNGDGTFTIDNAAANSSTAQQWEVIQTANQTSIHTETDTTKGTNYGVFALRNVALDKCISQASPPTMATNNWDSDVKQRITFISTLCTVSC